jgi:hypothetical protein
MAAPMLMNRNERKKIGSVKAIPDRFIATTGAIPPSAMSKVLGQGI